MTQIKATVKNALDKISEKQNLKSKKTALELEIGNVREDNEILRKSIMETKGAIEGYRAGAEKGEANYAANFKHYTDKKIVLEKSRESSVALLRKLTSDLDATSEKLANYELSVDIKIIKENQVGLEKAKKELVNCESTLSEKQSKFITFRPVDNTLEMLEQRKQMLVDEALGSDKKADIAKIDTAIAEQHEKDNVINASDRKQNDTELQTIAGLQSLVSELSQKVKVLSGQHNELLKVFFISMAGNDIEDYKKAAASIENSVQRLLGVTEIIKTMGLEMDSSILPYGDHGWSLAIPGFTLESKKLVNITNRFIDPVKTVDCIKADLKEKGILI